MGDLATEAGKAKKGCLGCFGIGILLLIVGVIAQMSGCIPSSETSESYQLGRKFGFMEGNVAMQNGRPRATEEEKEQAAWRVASGFTQETDQAKRDWVDGYKAGWDAGYDTH